jgi:hypothetical protein
MVKCLKALLIVLLSVTDAFAESGSFEVFGVVLGEPLKKELASDVVNYRFGEPKWHKIFVPKDPHPAFDIYHVNLDMHGNVLSVSANSYVEPGEADPNARTRIDECLRKGKDFKNRLLKQYSGKSITVKNIPRRKKVMDLLAIKGLSNNQSMYLSVRCRGSAMISFSAMLNYESKPKKQVARQPVAR